MPRKSRTTPGLITMVGSELRIVNGDVDSLKKLRKPGRPKKSQPEPQGSVPDYPTYDDLQEWEGFHAVRSRKTKQAKTKANQNLQAKFDELASEVRVGDIGDINFRSEKKWDPYPDVSRIEKSVPGSFCSCEFNTDPEDAIACLVHGVKFDDCACAGIDGLTGYRWCAGHRKRR